MNTNKVQFLSTEELADYLKISVGTVNNRLSRGDPMPPSCRVGRRRLYPVKELEEWLMSRLVSNDDIGDFDV
jgi:excisionase family DNA binding protein